jgi:ribonuclease P protein subunit RPR2
MAGGSKRPSGPPGTGPPPVTHRDLFHRVNFTLQASAYLQHLVPGRISDVNELGNAASGPSRRDSHSPALEVVVDRKGKRRAMEAEVDRRSKRRSDDVEAGADFGRLAREDMQSTRGMAVHNLLKLCVGRVVSLLPSPFPLPASREVPALRDPKFSPRPRDVL